jgi:hypothetical protein
MQVKSTVVVDTDIAAERLTQVYVPWEGVNYSLPSKHTQRQTATSDME